MSLFFEMRSAITTTGLELLILLLCLPSTMDYSWVPPHLAEISNWTGTGLRNTLLWGFIHIFLFVPGMSFNGKSATFEVTAFFILDQLLILSLSWCDIGNVSCLCLGLSRGWYGICELYVCHLFHAGPVSFGDMGQVSARLSYCFSF